MESRSPADAKGKPATVVYRCFNAAHYNQHLETSYKDFIKEALQSYAHFLILQEWPLFNYECNALLEESGYGICSTPDPKMNNGLCVAFDKERYEFVEESYRRKPKLGWPDQGEVGSAYDVFGIACAMAATFKEKSGKHSVRYYHVVSVHAGYIFDGGDVKCQGDFQQQTWKDLQPLIECDRYTLGNDTLIAIGGSFKGVNAYTHGKLVECGYVSMGGVCTQTGGGDKHDMKSLTKVNDLVAFNVTNCSPPECEVEVADRYGSDHASLRAKLVFE